jgi:hypothetical protein
LWGFIGSKTRTGGSLDGFAPAASGPVLLSASISKQQQQRRSYSNGSGAAVRSSSDDGGDGDAYEVSIEFTAATAGTLHFAGAAECTICCSHMNGSAIQLRVENATDPTGYSWQRSGLPTVTGNTVTALFTPEPRTATVRESLRKEAAATILMPTTLMLLFCWRQTRFILLSAPTFSTRFSDAFCSNLVG